jgi:prepilin-type N-terminal cleavage/methylation domain-containing protein
MSKNKKGFTIIEVVLVLAIAGLIFLMVFIALPALQRSQRNTQREDDLSRVLTAANDYQTNNNGKSPWDSGATNGNFVKRYIDDTCNTNVSDGTQYECDGDQFRDPDGENYAMIGAGRADGASVSGFSKKDDNWSMSVSDFDHTYRAVTYASCGDEGEAVKGTGNRQYAVYYILEGGAVSCNDNH